MSEKALMALEDDDLKEPLRRGSAKKAAKPKVRAAKQNKGDSCMQDVHTDSHPIKDENL